MTEEQRDEAIERIAQIDRMFDSASGYGSWMVMCANDRETLVDQLRQVGVMVEHKHQVRLTDGSRTD